ncbi:hypothetical protein ACFPT7_24870 [Acidicapsa dinghuensis]|uniref:DUF2269 family protein n=1 Tax=Acidicapsa dinghuensis TaxID=2218256 RepID=A0ABW1EP29_9BACT|nr:hypothetical protein [Acidicapsa dinghuensis]
MSQENNDRNSWHISEFQIGVPIVGAILMAGIRIGEEIFSKNPWTIGRAFTIVIALVFLGSILLSWQAMRKMFKAFDQILGGENAALVPSEVSYKLRKSIRYLISTNGSIILALVMVFYVLRRF